MELKINPEYEALLPKLSSEDFEALKESIRKNGLHLPLIVNQDRVLLDGHQRFRVCHELGIVPRVDVDRRFEGDLLGEKEFVIEINLKRRQLTTGQKLRLALPLIEIERERAKQRQLSMLKIGQERPLANQLDDGEGRTLEIVGQKVGLSDETLRQGLFILKNAPKEDLEKLDKGETSIKKLFTETKHAEKISMLREQCRNLETPKGIYDVIVIDPPWKWEAGEYDPENRRGRPNYPDMTIDEIKQLKIPSNENCVVWLWCVNRFIHDAYHVLEVWGFEPKTVLTWGKNRFGLGAWLRGQTEHCIMATKGKPYVNLTNQSTLLIADVREHSRKPDEFYKMVDSLCFGSKLDYFAREKREGWDIYGTNELQDSV